MVNWVDVRGVMRVLMEFRDRPIMLYSFGGYTEGDTLICPAAGAGCTALRFPMERMGFRSGICSTPPTPPMDIDGDPRLRPGGARGANPAHGTAGDDRIQRHGACSPRIFPP